ncbi:hypothetical protein JR316_0006261 [Psilocybe cubensis]|uniref:Uncharacterized protein n=2 Tax=Psilocybe cubensis TaxID=181762 RepID=A0A8H7XYY0_PSICU|nr:hypothetical protein JR316_0006261 [Psilocybe cubensis]KAH9481734.1 hypothetical protein JR316_0006261 [Psilocybe cubensis]
MYAGYSASQPLTNNPFIADGGSNPSARFPDLSSPPVTNQQQQQQYGGWGSAAMSPVSPQQQQQGMYQQYSQQQQQPQMTMGYAPQQQMGGGISMGGGGAGYLSPGVQLYPSHTGSGGGGAPFQPSSSFGQQLAAHVSGSSYSYLQGQQQQQQGNPNAYNPAQQQLQNNPGYVAQLDPYSSIGQLWGDSNQSQPQQQGQAQAQMGGGVGLGQSYSSSAGGVAPLPTGGYGVSASGEPHPRDYIRAHKAEIEAWDNFAWKQLLGAFETLMKAWETRKGELAARVGEMSAQMNVGMAYGPYYVAQIQQEGARLQGLQKEAENNFDSVAASLFQLREVFAGYRQSGDLASKRRVREAMNAALQGLPTFPQPY